MDAVPELLARCRRQTGLKMDGGDAAHLSNSCGSSARRARVARRSGSRNGRVIDAALARGGPAPSRGARWPGVAGVRDRAADPGGRHLVLDAVVAADRTSPAARVWWYAPRDSNPEPAD